MAYSRGRRLSKRQKRRSLKRKNVKSRKVMRGGGGVKGAKWLRNNWANRTSMEKTQILFGMNATDDSHHTDDVETIITKNDCK